MTFSANSRLRYLSLLVVALLASCGKRNGQHPAPPQVEIDTALVSRLERFAHAQRVEGIQGLAVYDLTARRQVYAADDTLAQPPASTLKLITGVAGLRLLGTDFRHRTTIFTRGRVTDDGVLQGDVSLRGRLDPDIEAADFVTFAKALRAKGIRQIGGRLRLDLLLHEPIEAEEHWFLWDLERSKYGILYQGVPRIRTALLQALRGQGIRVDADQVDLAPTTRDFHPVMRIERTIDRMTERMWKNSSNTRATAMLLTMGHHLDPHGDPAQAGVEYLRQFVCDSLAMTDADLAVSDSSLVIHDGCGLCVHNRLTPQMLVAVLRYAWDRPALRRKLLPQLATSGVDGTLARYMTAPTTRGRIHAKTGTLSHPYGVSSLAGYCRGSNGHVLAFAIMQSRMSVLDAHVLQRRFCEAMVSE